jgi:hypothetical protein
MGFSRLPRVVAGRRDDGLGAGFGALRAWNRWFIDTTYVTFPRFERQFCRLNSIVGGRFARGA